MEAADLFVAGQLAGKAEFLVGSLLRADLEYNAVAIDRSSHGFSLRDGHGQWLFVIHVLAIAGGFDAYQRVPMVGCHNRHGVDIVPNEQFAIVAIGCETFAAVMLLDPVDGFLTEYLAQIADGDCLHVIVPEECSQMPAPHAADADESHGDFLAWRHGSVYAEHRRRDDVGETRPT
jgi:hypothetical protein